MRLKLASTVIFTSALLCSTNIYAGNMIKAGIYGAFVYQVSTEGTHSRPIQNRVTVQHEVHHFPIEHQQNFQPSSHMKVMLRTTNTVVADSVGNIETLLTENSFSPHQTSQYHQSLQKQIKQIEKAEKQFKNGAISKHVYEKRINKIKRLEDKIEKHVQKIIIDSSPVHIVNERELGGNVKKKQKSPPITTIEEVLAKAKKINKTKTVRAQKADMESLLKRFKEPFNDLDAINEICNKLSDSEIRNIQSIPAKEKLTEYKEELGVRFFQQRIGFPLTRQTYDFATNNYDGSFNFNFFKQIANSDCLKFNGQKKSSQTHMMFVFSCNDDNFSDCNVINNGNPFISGWTPVYDWRKPPTVQINILEQVIPNYYSVGRYFDQTQVVPNAFSTYNTREGDIRKTFNDVLGINVPENASKVTWGSKMHSEEAAVLFLSRNDMLDNGNFVFYGAQVNCSSCVSFLRNFTHNRDLSKGSRILYKSLPVLYEYNGV